MLLLSLDNDIENWVPGFPVLNVIKQRSWNREDGRPENKIQFNTVTNHHWFFSTNFGYNIQYIFSHSDPGASSHHPWLHMSVTSRNGTAHQRHVTICSQTVQQFSGRTVTEMYNRFRLRTQGGYPLKMDVTGRDVTWRVRIAVPLVYTDCSYSTDGRDWSYTVRLLWLFFPCGLVLRRPCLSLSIYVSTPSSNIPLEASPQHEKRLLFRSL